MTCRHLSHAETKASGPKQKTLRLNFSTVTRGPNDKRQILHKQAVLLPKISLNIIGEYSIGE